MIDEPKPQNQPVKTKAEAFAEDPERFVDGLDLIIAIARSPEGPAVLCNPKSSGEARGAMTACCIELSKKIIVMEEMARRKQNHIVQPSGGILNAARRGLFKKRG